MPMPWSSSTGSLRTHERLVPSGHRRSLRRTHALFFWRPLSGQWSLLPNDLLDNAAPWSSERTPERAENPWLSDTIDVHSHFVALSEDARSGDLSWWDRSLTGGIPSLKAVVAAAVPLPPAAGGVCAWCRRRPSSARRRRVPRRIPPPGARHRPFRRARGCRRLRLHRLPRRVGFVASVKCRRIRTRLVVVGGVAGVGATTVVPCPSLRRSPRSTSRTSRSLPPMS